MKATRVPPTGVERRLGEDEPIITNTDPRGLFVWPPTNGAAR
ncbi:hypothetical protein [Actinoplanes sp. NPDC026623]